MCLRLSGLCNETALGTRTRPMQRRQTADPLYVYVRVYVCVCVGGSGNNISHPWLMGYWLFGFGSVLHFLYVIARPWKVAEC